MDAKEVIDRLNEIDIYEILLDLEANPIMTNNAIYCRTICHGGDSQKLYYYFDRKIFKCFTHGCKIGNIFNLLMMVKNWDFITAYNYICEKFNFSREVHLEERLDFSFFEKFEAISNKWEYTPLNKNILKGYYPFYYQGWLEEHITIDTMKKFNILFNVKDYRIVIPHYNIKGELIGIRRRNLTNTDLLKGKYMPEVINGVTYSHSLGGNLYGLNNTLQYIIESKTIILFEAEKSVLQLDSYNLGLGGVALCGSSLTGGQFEILVDLINEHDIKEVVVALDKEFIEVGDKLEEFYQRKIRLNIIEKLLPYVDVSVIWDVDNLLDYKNSPTDKGSEIFKKLLTERVKTD